MRFLRTSFIIVIAATVFGCAKRDSEGENMLEQKSLDAWMKQHAPLVERLPSGVYQHIEPNPSGTAIAPGDWVLINYLGTTLDGNVFVNRDKDRAKVLGTFSYKTPYVPQIFYYGEKNTGIMSAQYDAMGKMRQGERAKLYVPSHMGYGAYGSSFTNGYQGEVNLAANRPFIYDMQIVEVIKDIKVWEKDLAGDYAVRNNIATSVTDTLKDGLYFKLMNKVEPTKGEGAEEDKPIGEDEVVDIYYKGFFLDNFVFDTNIDTVAIKHWNSHDNDFKPMSFKASDGATIAAFKEAVLKMKKGESAVIVFTSTWGYGASGSTPFIQPYSPLAFYIKIKEAEKEDEEEGGSNEK